MAAAQPANNVLTRANERLAVWYRAFVAWRLTYFVLGISGTLLASFLAIDFDFLKPHADSKHLLQWLSAGLVALLTFLTPDKRATPYIRAWRLLDNARGRYQAGEFKADQLNDAIQSGETIIEGAGLG